MTPKADATTTPAVAGLTPKREMTRSDVVWRSMFGGHDYNDKGRDAFLALVPDRYKAAAEPEEDK